MATSLATSPRTAAERQSAARRLDAIGVHYGTALSSLGRDCLRGCERFLAPWRDEAIDLLEIGVGDGASLRTWREWFSAARLTGLDARRIHLDPPIAGCSIVQGNQADPAVLHRVVKDRRIHVVIDDGSRRAEDQIQSFLTLFPWLEPGAVYVCAGLPDDAAAAPDAEPATAGAWFAELGRVLAAGERDAASLVGRPGLSPIVDRVSGVFLMRGCAIVMA